MPVCFFWFQRKHFGWLVFTPSLHSRISTCVANVTTPRRLLSKVQTTIPHRWPSSFRVDMDISVECIREFTGSATPLAQHMEQLVQMLQSIAPDRRADYNLTLYAQSWLEKNPFKQISMLTCALLSVYIFIFLLLL